MTGTDLAGGRPRAGLPLLGAALALAGCGGEERLTKVEYEQKVRTLYAGVQDAFLATDVQSLDRLAPRVEAAQAELRRVADELDEARPPEEVERENEELVEGLREYAEDLDAVQEAAESGDQAAIDDFNREIGENEAIEQMAEAAEEMKHKGYDLGPIAEE